MKKQIIISSFLSAVLLVPAFLRAQDETEETATRLNQLQQQLNEQNQRIQDLEEAKKDAEAKAAEEQARQAKTQEEQAKKNHTIQEELYNTREELEYLALSINDEADEKKLAIWGFFDTTFYKAWYQHDNSVLLTENPPFSTFMMSHVNLYFSSEMTDTLRALVETGFSFAPLGYEPNVPIDAYVYNSSTERWELQEALVDDSEYERVDTTVPGGISSSSVRYGSISIVRAHLDWTPKDWLGFRVGQYLTPFGIWNEEHASTVLLGVYYPNLMNWDLVPGSQLGLQAFGSVFPSDIIQLKYAITLSNGRGPTSTVMDFDENKAMGARFQLFLNTSLFKITAGGYGYYGKYTDAERRAEIYLNEDLSRNYDNGSPIGAIVYAINKYKEYIITSDLSFEIKGLILFGEFVHRKVDFLKHPVMFSDYEFVQNGDLSNRLAASHYSQSAYGIVGYTFSGRGLGPVRITPYTGADWVVPDDSFSWFKQKTFRFGVNLRPSPFVAIKTEAIIDQFDEVLGGRMYSLAAQLAVSF